MEFYVSSISGGPDATHVSVTLSQVADGSGNPQGSMTVYVPVEEANKYQVGKTYGLDLSPMKKKQ